MCLLYFPIVCTQSYEFSRDTVRSFLEISRLQYKKHCIATAVRSRRPKYQTFPIEGTKNYREKETVRQRRYTAREVPAEETRVESRVTDTKVAVVYSVTQVGRGRGRRVYGAELTLFNMPLSRWQYDTVIWTRYKRSNQAESG